MTQSSKPSLLARLGRVDSPPPWPLTSAVVTVIFSFIVIIVGTTAATVWLGDSSTTSVIGWALGCMFMALMVWQTRARERDALKLGASSTPLALVMFIGVGAAIAIDVLGLALTRAFVPVPELLNLSLDGVSLVDIVLAVLFLVLAQPIGEELVFRGIALPAFRSAFGGWVGLLIASAAYGVFHWLAYTPAYSGEFGGSAATWYGLIAPILAGLVFGSVRVITGSTRAAIAAHMAFALFAIFKLLVLVG
ncbi:MAG: CPBP family intramembrane metalloprotease [Chloroflexi bacterium]|nr:CPBP family intramembrane metalloprotease [Chloroflexota bacterium]